MKRKPFAFRILLVPIAVTAITAPMQPARTANADDVFASIDNIEITRDEFERAVYSAARQTFYHGSPPGGEEFIEFRKDVADKMIVRELLLREARHRKVEPDRASINAQIAVYEDRYGDTERWQTEGPQMVAALQAKFEEDSILESLEADVRSAPMADAAVVRQFYDDNPSLFTEPAQNRVSIILLGVPASATGPVWQAARDEAQLVLERLQEGKSFEELASLHSADASAKSGGDMGYLHQGMLSAAAEEAVNDLAVGEVSGPVQALEGVAIFKLAGQRPATLRAFEEVRERASELWARETGERQWNTLVAELRSASEVRIDTDYLASLPEYAR